MIGSQEAVNFFKMIMLLIIFPIISLVIFFLGSNWVSTDTRTPIATFSEISAGSFYNATGFCSPQKNGKDHALNCNFLTKVDKRKRSLGAIDALKNSLSIFVAGFSCVAFIIISLIWSPFIGLCTGLYQSNWKIMEYFILGGFAVGAVTILLGFGGLYIFYLWGSTFFYETYTPAFFLIWSVIGLASACSGFYLGMFSLVNIGEKLQCTLSSNSPFIILLLVELVSGILYFAYIFFMWLFF